MTINVPSRRKVLMRALSSIAPMTLGLRVRAQQDQCPATESLIECHKNYGNITCIAPTDHVRAVTYHSKPPTAMKLPLGQQRTILTDSTVAGFDEALKKSILHPLSALLGVNPAFGYYDEQQTNENPNALASPDELVPGRRGTVLFGLQLLNKMLNHSDGDHAVMAICAHEFGHIKQYEVGAQVSIAKMLPCYCVELHADFMAGFFLRRLRNSVGNPNFASVGTVWNSWSNNSCSHGSRAQRIDALETGYAFGDPVRNRPLEAIVEYGIEYTMKYR